VLRKIKLNYKTVWHWLKTKWFHMASSQSWLSPSGVYHNTVLSHCSCLLWMQFTENRCPTKQDRRLLISYYRVRGPEILNQFSQSLLESTGGKKRQPFNSNACRPTVVLISHQAETNPSTEVSHFF